MSRGQTTASALALQAGTTLLLLVLLAGCSTTSPNTLRIRVEDGAAFKVRVNMRDTTWDKRVIVVKSTSRVTYRRAARGGWHVRTRTLTMTLKEGDGPVQRKTPLQLKHPAADAPGIDARGLVGGRYNLVLISVGQPPFPPDGFRAGQRYEVPGAPVDSRIVPAPVRCVVKAVTARDVTLRCEATVKIKGTMTRQVTLTARIARADGVSGHRVVETVDRTPSSKDTETERLEIWTTPAGG